MNKCSKCGAEFEGNFCPECGTPSQAPKVCPKCGAQLKENVKFCNNCGYAFLPTHSDETQTAPSAPTASAPTPVDWRNNKTLRKILLFAPLVIFALWSVLMFAFMAAPVLDGGGLLDNVTVYGFFNAELVEGEPDLAAITPSAAALLAVSLLSVLYAGWLAYAQFKAKKMTRWLSHYASALLYILVLVCTSVIAVKFNAYAEGMDDMKGSFVGVTVALTVVFLLLHAASLVLCKLLSIESITREEHEQAKQRFAEWRARRRHRREYRKQRRPIVSQRLKKEPFIRGRSCGAMCILAVIFIFLAIGLAFPLQWISYYTDYDTYFEKKHLVYYEAQFEELKDSWESLPACLELFYEQAQEYYRSYQRDSVAQAEGIDFEEWLNANKQSRKTLYNYIAPDLFSSHLSKKYYAWWEYKAYVSTAELYELGVDGYISQRYPDGFGDFVEEVTGTNSTTKEDYIQYCKQIEYDALKRMWLPPSQNETQYFISFCLMMFVPALVAAVFAIVACVLAFRRKWRASAVFGWILVILSFAAFLFMLLAAVTGYPFEPFVHWLYHGLGGADAYILLIVAFGCMLPLAVLFSLVNVFIQAYDECKARKRYNREYDEQMAAQGDKTALRMLNNQ